MTNNSVCKTCGFVGEPKKKLRGYAVVEIILYFIFLIPGFIYSSWRVAEKKYICSKCGSASIIPVDTPVGQKLINEMKENK